MNELKSTMFLTKGTSIVVCNVNAGWDIKFHSKVLAVGLVIVVGNIVKSRTLILKAREGKNFRFLKIYIETRTCTFTLT